MTNVANSVYHKLIPFANTPLHFATKGLTGLGQGPISVYFCSRELLYTVPVKLEINLMLIELWIRKFSHKSQKSLPTNLE